MELPSIVEALLTGSDEPLAAEEIARLIRARVAEAEDARARKIEDGENPDELPEWLSALSAISSDQVIAAIARLNHDYETGGRAFMLGERSKGWKIFTRAEYGEFVRQLFPGRKPERLSGPAMETLAIIAYRQPITKAAIEAVRGVACDGMLQKLLDRELVRIGGRAELPGRPLLYETTEMFYEHFGIRSIDDLPNSQELRRVKLPEPTAEAAPSAEEQLALSATGGNGSSGAAKKEKAPPKPKAPKKEKAEKSEKTAKAAKPAEEAPTGAGADAQVAVDSEATSPSLSVSSEDPTA